jgi:transposase
LITIGIDPHKRSHTAAALNDHAELRGQVRVSAATAVPTLRCWAARWPQRQWAVEGASGLGRLLAQQLVADGEQVVDVPAKLAARARFLATGNERKNDTVDAVSVADAAIRGGRLRRVTAEGDAVVLRLLADRRDDLNQERTRTLNRLHALVGELVAGGAKWELSATAAAALLGRIRPPTPVARLRKRLARDLLADLRRLDRALTDNAEQTATAVQASTTSLTEICGIGPVVAALIIGHVGDVARFPSPGHFATYNGTAPIEVSSGDLKRHRLSRLGDRQLNRALYVAALCQIRHDTAGRAYYRRKLGEHKTPAEALRSLKRQLSNVVYRHLVADQRSTATERS